MKVMKKKLRSSRKIHLRESVSLNNKLYSTSPAKGKPGRPAHSSANKSAPKADDPNTPGTSAIGVKRGRRPNESVKATKVRKESKRTTRSSIEKLRSSPRKLGVLSESKPKEDKASPAASPPIKRKPIPRSSKQLAAPAKSKPVTPRKSKRSGSADMECEGGESEQAEESEDDVVVEKGDVKEEEGEEDSSTSSSSSSSASSSSDSSNEDEEEEDENMELQVEDEWMETLMNEYWRVRHQFEECVNTEGMAALDKSRQPVRYTLHNGHTPAAFELHENVIRNQQLAFLRNENNSVVQKCSVIPLENIEATPPMQYWTLTEVNVIAEDEFTLSHIPFLGDAEDDTEFSKELFKTFPDGIHGTKEGCGQYINDWILYYTVKAVKAALPDLEIKTIFHCVHEQFPDKASVQDLIAMYPDLQLRFEPETIDRQELTNRKGELVANFSSSRLLNSYEVLVCHKCFCYDCTMHNATIGDGYGTMRKYSRPKENDGRHCSEDCYLNIYNMMRREQKMKMHTNGDKDLGKQLNVETSGDHAANNNSNSQSHSASSSSHHINDHKVVEWNPHEEAVFNVLRTTGEENYCKITQVLNMCSDRRKTCRELYEYACRTAPLSPRLELMPSPVKNGKKKGDSHRTFRAVKWASTNGKVENNCMYKPCNHKGECKKEYGCRCVIVENLCTKYCPCSDECPNRFPGCRCAPGNCRTRQCQCYFASWECDPDICKSCNCDKFDGCGEPICKNVSIQRGLQKRLLVAPSQVAGWGCFSQEDIEKNEFVSEYCGEVITQAESERRGKIYDKIKCSYLFGLNDEQVVDATRVGNVIRFANHSRNPNCRAKVIVVNGDHKIGIFANRHINRGEELFFDYAYNKSQQVAFLSKELTKSYY